MEVLYQTCCGVDVHQATVVACVRHPTKGGRRKSEVRTFGTTTAELLELTDWLMEHGVTHVAREVRGYGGSPCSISWGAALR
jgi:transposase